VDIILWGGQKGQVKIHQLGDSWGVKEGNGSTVKGERPGVRIFVRRFPYWDRGRDVLEPGLGGGERGDQPKAVKKPDDYN